MMTACRSNHSRLCIAIRIYAGGTPVFCGTRVPVQSLFDYLEGGETADQFVDQFPSVSKEQALAALDLARDSVLASARSA